MNSAELESIRSAALELADAERAQLASDLVASLDGPADADAAAAWDTEICRRINEINSGAATLMEAGEVLARARARIQRG
ncbi:addiction module protein [Parahaliea mediterranea]|uniref:Addiction module protein n=1 Tax=Parahaliea mediterranea TaxID=651086 RepID=A0A939DE08_9GAMM|nr:addiction module protein [Parahaliea mediterranea]MBN7796329.1 addiction module protein [Parahaliea mediterranea]